MNTIKMLGFTAEASLYKTYRGFQLIGPFNEVQNTITPQRIDFDTRPRICDDPALKACKSECRQLPKMFRSQCLMECTDAFCFR
jgi:hypothetical protein